MNDEIKWTPLLLYACKIPKPDKILYARYICSPCLCLVKFLCAQVTSEIRNPRTRVNYLGMHHVHSPSVPGPNKCHKLKPQDQDSKTPWLYRRSVLGEIENQEYHD